MMEVDPCHGHGEHRDTSTPKRKSSAFKACLRCHRRKQRCTGFPACSGCQSAGVACTRESTAIMRKLAGLSKEELLERLDSLEARLSTAPQADTGVDPPGLRDNPADQQDHLHLSNASAHDREALDDSDILEGDRPAAQVLSPVPLEEDVGASLPQLDDATGKQILNAYLESMHRRVPFFDFSEVYQLHKQRHRGIATDPVSQFRAFKLCMVYAIGALVLKLTGLESHMRPDHYVELADCFKKKAKNPNAEANIEAALFGVLYRLRSCLDSDAWYEIGLAIRMAIEAGMHREDYYKDLDSSLVDWRRRLFWGVYVMERNICFSLKRPFSIPDHDIDAGLPSQSSLHPPATILSRGREDSPSRSLDLSTFVAIISLVRIKSKIHTSIYRVDKDISFARTQVSTLLGQIRDFERTLPIYTDADQEFLQLHVNNAVRTLIEPFLISLAPNDELILVCVQAAGRLCQLFKRLRLRKAHGYSFTMVNSVFVAGMTICYSVFKNPLLWTPGMANDLRACSSILFVIAERNSAFRKYRDVLETIINGVMEHIEQATSPKPSISMGTSTPGHSGEESPIAFHKLKDTFKEFDFELPSHVYPNYTTDRDTTGKRSSCSPLQSIETKRDGTYLNLERADEGSDVFASADDLYLGSDMLSYTQGTWDMNNLYDDTITDAASGLCVQEPYTQQMMGELLAQSYLHR